MELAEAELFSTLEMVAEDLESERPPAEGGSRGGLPERHVRTVMRGVLEALSFSHRHRIVQLDHRAIGHPGWIEYHHDIARLQDGRHRGEERPFAARCHHDLVGRNVDVVLAGQFGDNRIKQFG